MKCGLFAGLLVLMLILFSSESKGQILVIDKVDTMPYANKTSLGLVFSTALEIDQQKQMVVDASNSVEASVQRNKSLLIFSGNYRMTYSGDNDILNVGYVHLRYRYDYKNKIHPEAFLQYQWDDVRGIEYRKVAGANMRYNNYVHPRLNVVVGLGLMLEVERWNYSGVLHPDDFKEGTVDNDYLKVNSYLKFELKTSDNSDLYFTTFYQFRPDSEYRKARLANSLRWAVSISKRVQMATGINTVYDPYPVVPIQKFYFNLTNGVIFKI